MTDAVEMAETIRQYGVRDERALQVIMAVDRASFVPAQWQSEAYSDNALAIGYGQTISQPYTVARMIELLIENSKTPKLKNSKVLEVGTGSGWQTAILAQIFGQVYSIERIPQLAREARSRIDDLQITNVSVKVGDGKRGWPKHAPYQAIIVAADANRVPPALIEQLTGGGRIVIPVQGEMTRVTKEKFGTFSFVPLV